MSDGQGTPAQVETIVEDAPRAMPPEVAGPRGRRFARTRFIRRPAPDVRDIREGQRAPTVMRRDAVIRRTLAFTDLLAAAGALTAAVAVGYERPSARILLMPFAVVVLLKLARLYDRDENVIRKSTLDQAHDRARGVVRVQRGEDEVPRERASERELRGLGVANLSHHDHIGVAAQH